MANTMTNSSFDNSSFDSLLIHFLILLSLRLVVPCPGVRGGRREGEGCEGWEEGG